MERRRGVGEERRGFLCFLEMRTCGGGEEVRKIGGGEESTKGVEEEGRGGSEDEKKRG